MSHPVSISSATSTADVEPRLANRTSPRDSAILDNSRSAKYNQDDDVLSSAQRYEGLKREIWDEEEDKWKTKASLNRQSGRGCVGPMSSISRFLFEFRRSVKHVALLVLPYYLWLIWSW
jgi:hypothetical protein